MAYHITALSTGIADAPSGSAAFFKRGTTTPATVYSTIDANSNEALGATITLDSGGRYVGGVYAKERVDVVIYTSTSTELTRFSDGGYDNGVDVESQSFTGTLPSGSQGAGGHTLLRSALDKLTTSFGTTDFNVLETGQTTALYLKDALKAVRSTYTSVINVLAYGATGDGATDDAPAIQAAINAAVSQHLPVFFPDGQYFCASGLNVSAPVSLIGGDCDTTSLLFSIGAGTVAITIAANTNWSSCVIEGLCIKPASGSLNAYAIKNLAYGTTIRNCRIREWATSIQNQRTCMILFCDIKGATSVTAACDGVTMLSGSTGSILAFNNISCLGAWDNTCHLVKISDSNISVIGGTYDISAGGTLARCIETGGSSATGLRVIGANYLGSSGDSGLYIAHDVSFYEAFNESATSGLNVFKAAAATYVASNLRLTRDSHVKVTTEASATYTPNQDNKYHYIKYTNAGIAIGAPSGGTSTQGMEMCIVLENKSGGSITPTFNAIYHVETVPAMADADIIAVRLRYQPASDWLAASGWYQDGKFVQYT